MCSWWHATEIPKRREFLVKLHLVNGDQYVWLPESPMSQLLSAAHQSQQQFGVSQTLFTLLGAGCVHVGSCFFESDPDRALWFLERYDRKPEVVTADLEMTLFYDPVCAVEHFSSDWSILVLSSKSTESLFNSVRTQQILYCQSINLTTRFGSLSHHQTNSQTILKVSSVHLRSHTVHIYWMYLQYGLWIGLKMARWAETCCQIHRLIIKYLLCSDWIE